MTSRGTLRNCPECRQPWPRGAEFDIRSFRWLDDLPRHVSPTNLDCLIHDGALGRNRFLVLETKHQGEAIQSGQAKALVALAGLDVEHLGVRVLSGTTGSLGIHRVTRDGIEERGTPTTPVLVRAAVVNWLNGSTWRDAESELAAPAPEPAETGWPDGINPHVTPERRAELLAVRESRPCNHDWQEEAFGTFRCSVCGERYEPAA